MSFKHFNTPRYALIVLFGLLILFSTLGNTHAEPGLFSTTINLSVTDLDSVDDSCNDVSVSNTSKTTESFGTGCIAVLHIWQNLAENRPLLNSNTVRGPPLALI